MQYDWFAEAFVDRLTGDRFVFLFYSARWQVDCGHGRTGSVEVFFEGSGPGTVFIRTDLSLALAAASVRGVEQTARSCGERSSFSSRPRRFDVRLGLLATAPADQYTEEQCVDLEDGNGPILVTATNTGRTAVGTVVVDGAGNDVEGAITRFEVTGGSACDPD